MFGIWNSRKPVVLAHQYAIIPDFETSVPEFYELIESDLTKKKFGGLTISRIEYAEGGLLSAKRTYLRMQRERLVFDVCSARFGSHWLFSYRFSEIPCSLRVWELLVLLVLLVGIVIFYGTIFGWLPGSIIFALSVIGLAVLMRNILSLGLQDLDASLLRIPVIGGVYEALLRRESYFRQDTRLAYVHIIRETIVEKVSEVTTAKGVEHVEFYSARFTTDAGIRAIVDALTRPPQ